MGNINISALTSDKFIPSWIDSFICYQFLINNYKENLPTKSVKPSNKLEVLKQSLGGELFDAIKLYNQGDQSIGIIDGAKWSLLKTRICSCRVYISDLVSSNTFQNKFILLELEAKTSTEGYSQWTSEKENTEALSKQP